MPALQEGLCPQSQTARCSLCAFACSVPPARNAVPYVSDLGEMLGSEKTLHNSNAENMPFVAWNMLSVPPLPFFHSSPIKQVLVYM